MLDVRQLLRSRLLAAVQLRRALQLPSVHTNVYRLCNRSAGCLRFLSAATFGASPRRLATLPGHLQAESSPLSSPPLLSAWVYNGPCTTAAPILACRRACTPLLLWLVFVNYANGSVPACCTLQRDCSDPRLAAKVTACQGSSWTHLARHSWWHRQLPGWSCVCRSPPCSILSNVLPWIVRTLTCITSLSRTRLSLQRCRRAQTLYTDFARVCPDLGHCWCASTDKHSATVCPGRRASSSRRCRR